MSSHPANALAKSSSAYLRSAMHQPVRWHEWGPEALAIAQTENKPILLDIGAVWCHWCHVMDRESYESEATAAIINEHFIAVKVDRDERPDVDARYQTAVQSISGQGGWPLTAFLTPNGHPFFGGTYFPPENRYGRMGFPAVLQSIARAWQEKREEVIESASSVMEAIEHQESFKGRDGDIHISIVEKVIESAAGMFDSTHGGFGSQPKFPRPGIIDLLLDATGRTQDTEKQKHLRHMAEYSLRQMASGGMYDQLAGGFHRYSVDAHWIVPHFEKMSYDNSELMQNYVHASQASGDKYFADVARDIILWVDEWLSDRERGGFYASQDADYSLDDDGDYFTWTLAEARESLDHAELALVSMYYDIGPVGEMHHDPAKNVLYISEPLEDVARKLGMSLEQAQSMLDRAKEKMLAARVKRPTPYVDKTIYTNWNGMMISAYFAAANALKLDHVRAFAVKSLDHVLNEAWDGKAQLMRHVIAYSDPSATMRPLAGVLDDYVFTALACLDAYETTGNIRYFNAAHSIADAAIHRFYDPTGGGFFDMDSSSDPALLIGALSARRKPLQDTPTPAGNPAAALLLMRLYHLTNDESYKDKAEVTLETFAGIVDKFGIFAATYAKAVRLFLEPHMQIVIIGKDDHADKLHSAAMQGYSLSRSVIRIPEAPSATTLPPALTETIPNLPGVKNGKSIAVVCSGFTCKPPVSDPDELWKLLSDENTQ